MTNIAEHSSRANRPFLYILVVGFHHKKGCQIDFMYPNDFQTDSLADTNSSSDKYCLPRKWKYLPSLALPDGSHNHESDYVYFHLEDCLVDSQGNVIADEPVSELGKPRQQQATIFGVSCYRQINVSEMTHTDPDVTRNSLQKSVCVLSKEPLYGSIRIKLETITEAFFHQKDFHKTEILESAFEYICQSYTNFQNDLNYLSMKPYSLLSSDEINKKSDISSNYLMGLSLGDIVSRYQHQTLVLFKLLLLQKKCLFLISPASKLSSTIISLVTLLPEILIDKPSNEQAETKENCSSQLSNSQGYKYCSGFFDPEDLIYSELIRKNDKKQATNEDKLSENDSKFNLENETRQTPGEKITTKSSSVAAVSKHNKQEKHNNDSSIFDLDESTAAENGRPSFNLNEETHARKKDDITGDKAQYSTPIKSKFLSFSNLFSSAAKYVNNSIDSVNQVTIDISSSEISTTPDKRETPINASDDELLSSLLLSDFGMPFQLFSKFNMLHPYLSLHYLENFITINKIDTPLFCTMFLMQNLKNRNDSAQPIGTTNSENNSSSLSANESNEDDNSQYKFSQTKVGYTIGTTNVLFKQRLYDKLDAFVDENNVDFIKNDDLKKKLELTKADMRFISFVIKNVNTYRENCKNTEKSELENNDFSNGSDDWIRVHFKWYFFSLLGSMVKEDLSMNINCDLDILLKANANEIQNSNSSSSSLENSVVDVNNFLDADVSQDDKAVGTSKTKANAKSSQANSKSKLRPSPSFSSTKSMASTHSNQESSLRNYRDDFNGLFVDEFKKTMAFQLWYTKNKRHLESNLFKLDEHLDQQLSIDLLDPFAQNAAIKNLKSMLGQLNKQSFVHPCSVGSTLNDIKLRLNFAFNKSESGKKINKAFSESGKLFSLAFNSAKSSFSQLLKESEPPPIISPSHFTNLNNDSNQSVSTTATMPKQNETNVTTKM